MDIFYQMRKTLGLILVLIILFSISVFQTFKTESVSSTGIEKEYWLVLHRKANKEFLYFGEPGKKDNSALVKVFNVKSGIPGQRPTPLPRILEREYWLVTSKAESSENPETAPYFLTLDIPVAEDTPFGPSPYLECNGQCNWELPGAFGLHGVNGDLDRLSSENPGSSGCIRHSDSDITYLYNLLNFENGEVRYYIEDV